MEITVNSNTCNTWHYAPSLAMLRHTSIIVAYLPKAPAFPWSWSGNRDGYLSEETEEQTGSFLCMYYCICNLISVVNHGLASPVYGPPDVGGVGSVQHIWRRAFLRQRIIYHGKISPFHFPIYGRLARPSRCSPIVGKTHQ